jgi:GH18 family chitinase
MKTATDIEHAKLVKKYHTLATKIGLDKFDKSAIMESYGVTSSLDLTVSELQDLCLQLEKDLNPNAPQLDKLRKQVMASIGGWLRTICQESDAQRIKGIACRATGHRNFNDIPAERLRNIYHTFLNKQKDYKGVNKVTAEELEFLASVN